MSTKQRETKTRSRSTQGSGPDILIVCALVLVFLGATGWMNMAIDAPPLVDEPIFAKSALHWAETGDVEISGLSAPIAVFDTIWGGVFARLFGGSYQSLRWSTIVLTALSGPFVYWMLAQLRPSRPLRTLGLATYLFSPLVVVLSGTFMTDMHAAALGAISASLFVRGIRSDFAWKWMAAGSSVACLGFLSRPQLLVIPIAAVLALGYTRLKSREALMPIAAVGVPVLLTLGLYSMWASGETTPFIREISRSEMMSGLPGSIPIYASLAAISASVYIGLIAIPLFPMLVTRWSPAKSSPAVRAVVVGLLAFGTIAVVLGRDPTLGQAWVSQTGFAGIDRSHLGERSAIWPDGLQVLLVLLGVLCTATVVVAVGERWPTDKKPVRRFLLLVLAGSVAAATIASMSHPGILDRYWAPMIPVIVALAVGAAKTSRRRIRVAIGSVMLIAAFALLGTYDGLVAQKEIVRFTNDSLVSVSDPEHFDGGASWSALTFGVADDDSSHVLNRSGPYWVRFYAVTTDPTHGVALQPLDGYRVLGQREIASILHFDPVYVYLIETEDPDGFYFLRTEDF